MGWVMMSERALNRIEVLAQIDDCRLNVQNGANMLDITKRQMFRLLKRYRTEGLLRSATRRVVKPGTTRSTMPSATMP